ncbi:MAG: DsbA family protein [Patescibacteria group bacterium]
MTETPSKKTFSLPVNLNFNSLLIGALVIGAFVIGSLWTKVQYLEKGGGALAQGTANNQQPAAAAQPQQPTKGIASVDDDPVLGDKNAPVTIIEFSDYECPFCKRHFEDTFPQLVKEYVDKGKVKIVYRDFPLSFHDPMATKEAVAANCAKEQGGDKKYFEFHDEIFKRTTSNGNGLNDDKIQTIAKDLGLNTGKFTSCLSNKAMEDEVKKDIADGSAAGASGTPSFIVGKSSSDGKIDGDLVVGAQPFAAFKAVIDPLLQ